MKKTSKILFAVLALTLAISVFAVLASADSGSYTVVYDLGGAKSNETVSELPDYKTGDYIPYDDPSTEEEIRASYRAANVVTSGNTMTVTLDTTAYFYKVTENGSDTYYTTDDMLYNHMNKKTSAIPEGVVAGTDRTVTLLGDCHVSSASSSVSIDSSSSAGIMRLSLDLNGFRLVFAPDFVTGSLTAFSVSDNAELNVYSSRPGAEIFQASYTNFASSTIRSYSLFTVSGTARFNIGDFTKSDGTFCDGDNITTYSNMFILAQGRDRDSQPAVTIAGGTHNRATTGYMTAFFSIRDGSADTVNSTLTINIIGSHIHADTSKLLQEEKTYNRKSFVINLDGCTFTGDGNCISSTFQERTVINAQNTYFLSPIGSTTSLKLGIGNRVLQNVQPVPGIFLARTYEHHTVDITRNTFSFTDENGNVLTGPGVSDNVALISPDSFKITTETKDYTFSYVTADETNSSEITWISPTGETITEIWLDGSTPTPPTEAIPESETCTYSFGDLSVVSGDATYKAAIVPNFIIRSNLTLASDFLYNIYIPTDVDYIKSLAVFDIANNAVTLTKDAETVSIAGVEHYKYTFNIPAPHSAEAFTLSVEMPYEIGGTETYKYELEVSIPMYGALVVSGNYSETSDNLIYKTFAYIKAVCEYFRTESTNTYYSDICKIPAVTAPAAYAGVEKSAIPSDSDVYSLIDSISVIFDAQLKFRYFIKSDFDFTGNSVSVTYKEGTEDKVVEITAANVSLDSASGLRYFDVSLKASNLRTNMAVKVNQDLYHYSLNNYIYSVNNTIVFNNTAEKTRAQNLVYSLYEYSVAASQLPESGETPSVSITLQGTPIEEYKLVAVTPEEIAAANEFNRLLTKEQGITLELVSSYNGNSIEFRTVSTKSKFDCNVAFEGRNLIVKCAFKSFFEKATRSFVNDNFLFLTGDCDLASDFESNYYYGKILYSDFDDLTTHDDDFEAIRAAHDVANMRNYPVYAPAGSEYEIKATGGNSIEVMTDTYWNGASFIIDDTDINLNDGEYIIDGKKYYGSSAKNTVDLGMDQLEAAASIFHIVSEYSSSSLPSDKIENLTIDKNTVTKIDTGLGYAAMLLFYNSDNKQYIRYGGNANSGSSQRELIMVDAEGNIDENTPFLFDYAKVTSVNVYRADSKPITVDGGGATFTTKYPQTNICQDSSGGYAYVYRSVGGRNITVNRSNTTVKNINHVVEDELPILAEKSNSGGHTYSGFFSVSNCSNVEFNNCSPYARMKCVEGTYDLSLYQANDVRYIGCIQSNFWERQSIGDGTHGDGIYPNVSNRWYIMGSNYVKNITYDRCTLTRFDAHAGCYNATIKNSTVAYLRLTGGGDALIENTRIVGTRAQYGGQIQLREDYGGTWNGTITLKDVTFDNYQSYNNSTYYNIINSPWACHYFGYTTYMPNVIIDNIMFTDKYPNVTTVNVFSPSNKSDISSITSAIPQVVDDNAKTTTVDEKQNSIDKVTEYFEAYGLTSRAEWTEMIADWSTAAASAINAETKAFLTAQLDGINTVVDFNAPTYELASGTVKNVNPYQPPEFVYYQNIGQNHGKDLTIKLYNGQDSGKYDSIFEGVTDFGPMPTEPVEPPYIPPTGADKDSPVMPS